MSTFYFIKKHQFDDTLKISARLIDDKEDLIHKAVGWMLREIGNRDLATEKAFLKPHYQKMPRTMLRYPAPNQLMIQPSTGNVMDCSTWGWGLAGTSMALINHEQCIKR